MGQRCPSLDPDLDSKPPFRPSPTSRDSRRAIGANAPHLCLLLHFLHPLSVVLTIFQAQMNPQEACAVTVGSLPPLSPMLPDHMQTMFLKLEKTFRTTSSKLSVL